MKLKEELFCDFCMSQDIVASFAAPDNVVLMAGNKRTLEWHSGDDGWAACEECAQLMESGRLEELADRAIAAPGNGMNPRSDAERAVYRFLLLGQYNKINPKREAA